MRISDWSSDVCSSDLKEKIDSASLRDTGYESLWSFVTFDTFWLWPKNSASLAQRRSCILNNRRCRGPSRNWKRSEERRVGKECVSTSRSWWATEHSQKKNKKKTKRAAES